MYYGPGNLEKSAYDRGHNLKNGLDGLPNGEEIGLCLSPNGLNQLPGGCEYAADGSQYRLDAGEDVGLEERNNGGNGGDYALPRCLKVRLYLRPYLLYYRPYILEDLFCLCPKCGQVALDRLKDGVYLLPEPLALVV